MSSGSLLHSRTLTDVLGSVKDELPTKLCLASLKILGTLGRGAYGKVMLAETPGPGETSLSVAAKVIGKANMSKEDARDVRSEVRMLRMLAGDDSRGDGSAFVQKIYDAFQTKDYVFIVMVRTPSLLNWKVY